MTTLTGYTLTSDDDKPNEDWWVASETVVVVLDGATIRTDTGCVHGLPWFVRQLGSTLFSAAQNVATPLPAAIKQAIEHVVDQHSDTCDLTHPGTPSAAIGIVRDTGDRLDWASLGDVTVLVDTINDGVCVTSDDRVSYTAQEERAECDRHLLGTDGKMDAIHAMKPKELAARNVEGGYWIASVDPSAAKHALTGSVQRRAAQSFAVYSDGVGRALDFGLASDAGDLLDQLHRHGPAQTINAVREAERDDSLGKAVPRNKKTDDATAVIANCWS
ncbi:hypothetical protein [Salinifilum ghardaiensis]